ncbi:hypothetical protein AVEN_218287-1 [Araneus ventricosus]|uniref:Uncharacterized protein n=1 Tax=Araneus ventricosus TaxID=182803 RepID=A0A4Y2R174_ARAVE|nr:hypothetical protein AVEN_218287-1 [Araneus ventricosus]
MFESAPQFSYIKFMHGLLSLITVGLRVERRHLKKSVCLQDVVLVDQTDENRLGLSLSNDYPYRAMIIPTEQVPAEDESDALNLDGEVTEYTIQETDSETHLSSRWPSGKVLASEPAGTRFETRFQ